MTKFIGIGDLHLTDNNGRGGLYKYVESADAVVMEECLQVCTLAVEKGIKHIFLLGDVCENPIMSYEGMLAFLNFTDTSVAKKLTFHVILGNHDKVADDSSAGHSLQVLMRACPSNFIFYESDAKEKINNALVRFLPWPSSDFKRNQLNVAHIEVHSSKSDSGRLMEDEGLSKSKAVSIIGHLHTAHRVRNTYYGGTLSQKNFGEPIGKYFTLIDYTSDDDYEIEFIPFKPRYTLHNYVVNSRKDLKGIPDTKFDLVKLIMEDGIDMESFTLPASVVDFKPYKTKAELKSILTEDLMEGSEMIIQTDDMFNNWLDKKGVTKKLKRQVQELKDKLLR